MYALLRYGENLQTVTEREYQKCHALQTFCSLLFIRYGVKLLFTTTFSRLSSIFHFKWILLSSQHTKFLIFILYTISQGKSEFIGRTVAKPHVKLAEEPYTKPHFPPSLEWYELTRGPDHAGELLATFELLHVS